MIIYLACALLFMIGLYCIAVKKNLIKIIMGLIIIEYSINLFLGTIGYRSGGLDPILKKGAIAGTYVDPVPQAMAIIVMLTGLATTVLMVAIAIRLYDRFGTFDVTKMRNLKG